MNTNITSKTKGFTLIETLVAIAVLLTAIVAPLTIAARSISYTNFARDQIIASYLAFDSLESIIAIRNDNIAHIEDNDPGYKWDDGIKCSPGDCTIDTFVENVELKNCNEDQDQGNSGCYLFLDSSGIYNHRSESSTNKVTKFQRMITVADVSGSAGEEIKITSRVKFTTGVLTREVSLTLNLFNPSTK